MLPFVDLYRYRNRVRRRHGQVHDVFLSLGHSQDRLLQRCYVVNILGGELLHVLPPGEAVRSDERAGAGRGKEFLGVGWDNPPN